MAKLGILLLLMVCIHASLAGYGGRRQWKGSSRWIKSRLEKLGGESSEGGESAEGRPDYSKMRDEDMTSMMMMRMKRMLKPLRDLFVKVGKHNPRCTSMILPWLLSQLINYCVLSRTI